MLPTHPDSVCRTSKCPALVQVVEVVDTNQGTLRSTWDPARN